MKVRFPGRFAGSIGGLVLLTGQVCPSLIQAAEAQALPADPATAWHEVEQGLGTLRPPAERRRQPPTPDAVAAFQKQLQSSSRTLAVKAREFLRRFPKDEHAGDARFMILLSLSHALAAGDAEAEKELQQFVEAALSDPSLEEEEKAKVLLMSGAAPFMKKTGMRYFTEDQNAMHAEMDRAMIDSLRGAIQRFPKDEFAYVGLLAVADRSPPEVKKQLAAEILATAAAPENVKSYARHLQAGTFPYQIGKPLDIRFTALDGREVDLAKLKGKIVLVEFWSTTCGPCIAEMPRVKAAYEKFHDRGFEIIGINLDDQEAPVRRFLKEHDLPWPQHFDGKGSGNRFAVQYGVFSIPTMWLVDQAGNLRDIHARGDLESRVGRLLEEK